MRFWILFVNQENVGRLDFQKVDQPWIECVFRPTAHFDVFAHLFHQEALLLEGNDEEEWETIFNQVDALEITLVDHSGARIQDVILHIDSNNKARFRY